MTNQERPDPKKAVPRPEQSEITLNHGVASLVAQDSPDDSQLGAPPPADRNRDQA